MCFRSFPLERVSVAHLLSLRNEGARARSRLIFNFEADARVI